MPSKFHTPHDLPGTLQSAALHPGQSHLPCSVPVGRHRDVCVTGWSQRLQTLLAFRGQGPGTRTTLQHTGRSHTARHCLTQNTGRVALHKMPQETGQRPVFLTLLTCYLRCTIKIPNLNQVPLTVYHYDFKIILPFSLKKNEKEYNLFSKRQLSNRFLHN